MIYTVALDDNRPKTPNYHDKDLGDLTYCTTPSFYFKADGHYINDIIKHSQKIKIAKSIKEVVQSYTGN